MKGTFTFTDGASNQKKLNENSGSESKGGVFHIVKDLFKKVKHLFVHEEIIEPIEEVMFIEESMNYEPTQAICNQNAVTEKVIPDVVIIKESHSSQLNYQLNKQQMNLFTYLRRAITYNEQSFKGKFLEQFKTFLSVIVGAAPDDNAPHCLSRRDFGILSSIGGSKLLSNKILDKTNIRSWASALFLTLFTAFGTLAQSNTNILQPDLSVKKTISTQSPSIGQDVTYTVKVRNEGTTKATGVELKDIMPDGVVFKSVSVGSNGSTTNSTTAGVTTIVWNIGEVPATSTDLTMTIVATVIKRGLHFNTAEITKEQEQDLDSTPNNNTVGEDDQDATCFSIEDYFYKGDNFTITLPAGYSEVNWTKKVGGGNAVAVTSTTPGVTLSADKNTIVITDITAYTEFAFTAKEKNCPVNGCCPAKFIYGPIGSIGDYVFTDVNKDGIQDPLDTKLPGIKVQLYTSDGLTLLDEVTTDANGKYLFDSLETGSYKVKFILPSGASFSDTGKGTTATDSDAGLNGFSGVINIDVDKTGIDKDNPTIDAGIVGNLGSIGDFVFRDDNSNGIQDIGEPGILGVKVDLYKGAVLQSSTTTDANGNYNFPGLSSGTDYRIVVTAPTQSKFTKSNTGGNSGGSDLKDSDVGANGSSHFITIDVTKAATDTLRNNPNIDAGIIPLGSIGDYVFNDNNGNGIQDDGDTKLPGIKVTLTDKDGNILFVTTTNSDGKYEFIVPSGEYFVIFDKPVGSTFSPTGSGTGATDSDADPSGKSGKITIDATKPIGDQSRNNTSIDAGLIPNKGTIGDFVFTDSNGNNKQDAGEPGLSGVTVELYDATGTTKLFTTTTDVNGKYLFSGLESGGYKVKFILPTGKTFVTPNAGNSTAEDSDAGMGGFSGVINIDVTKSLGDIGRNNLTIDAGVKADCIVNPGTLATTTPNLCLMDAGSVVLTATVTNAPTVPTGYLVKYVLTKGSDLVIQQLSNAPTFTVNTTGEYRIHTLVYDGNSASNNFLDLSVVVPGTTKGGDVIGIINDKKLCAALDATGAKFNVNSIPEAPTFAGKTICGGETAKIGLEGPVVLGVSYAWFNTANATTPFATTQSIDVTPAITTTYFVETTSVVPGACTSKRGSVMVTVNPKPENPVVVSTLSNDCTKNLLTVNLSDAYTTIPSGSVIEWHVANNPTSAIITNTTTVGAGTYYAFAKSTTAGCYSGGVAVTVIITPCNCQNPATVSVSPIAAVCGSTSAIIQLGATIGGGATSGTWTSNGTGTFDNSTSLTAKYTPSAGDVTAGSVEFTFTTNDPDGQDIRCNAVSAKTILILKARPAAPTSLQCEPVICLGDANKLFSVSQGNIVKWYATATSTTSLGTATVDGFIVTPTAEGIFTYFAEATTPDGCVSERSSISFTVNKCMTDLAVIKKAYTPDAMTAPDYLLGQTATYSIEAQNIGDANATDVKVTDILPAGATFVSSTPTGEYNSSTGVWTIGNLTKGSTKSLLIQVTLGTKGSVVNTATISGTNEDPTKSGNNTSTVTINVADVADLSLTKIVNKSVVNAGDEIEYTITVLNSGPNTATNVEVKDKLPVGLTYVSSSTLTESAGVLTGMASSIAKGATAVFTFKAKVMGTGKITNLAEVSKSDQKDPDSTPGNATTKPNEDDDDSVDINSTPVCNIDKPIIACGCTQKTICLGSEVTLTATGCSGSSFIWSNGGTTSSITVSPRSNQTYTVFCQKDNCKSESSNAVEVKVIVVDSPLLSASPSRICAGESTTLTASGCRGLIEWQTSPKQTGPFIKVAPIVSETFRAVCKENDCVSAMATVDVIVTPTPKAPIIVCEKGEICPGETITMTAMNCNGRVKWSNGQETSTITVFPQITTSYTVTCSVNGCTSDESNLFVLTVKPVIVPIIKTTDLTVCTGGTATLTVEGCSGKVTWYFDGKTLTGATIIVKPIATTTYSATCSTPSCTSDKSSPVTVQVANPSPPIVSSGTSTICAGSSVDLTATGCESGIVTWSDGQKGAVVTVKPTVSTAYTATCSIGSCVSEISLRRNITVTDFAKPTITANILAICAGNSVTLTANGCNGTVKWSDGITGSPRTVTPMADVKYTATCESATCKSDVSNELAIKVNTSSQAPVISSTKNEICTGESVTLSAVGCTGTIKWSDGSTGTTVTVRPTTTTTYSATCSTNTCESPKSNEKTITVNSAVVLNLTASASNPRICAGAETTLTLAGCTGTITWTGGLTGASIKVKPTETTDYTATCSGVACATNASATVKVTVLPGATTPNIAATNTQICAGAEAVLTANNCNGALLWSNGATTVSITVKPSVTTIYSVKCTVDGCGEAKTSQPITVKVGTPDAPTVSSSQQSVCAGGSVVLTAVGCSSGIVQWSNGKTGATLTETVNSTTVYSAVCKLDNCNSSESNKVTVGVTIPSVPTISCATSTICAGSTITLIATGCEGTVKWSDNQTGAIVTVTPIRTTDYTATCTVGTCTSSPSSVATVNVGNPPAPTITCNAKLICQGVTVTLTATNCTGTIVWSDGQVGNIISARPNATTKYTAICKLDKCESGLSNEITVSVGAGIKTPTTINLNNVCPFLTVDLASGVTSALSAGGTFEYRTGVLPTSPLVSNPNAVGTGTYYVFEKTGAGCYSSPGVINTFINTDCKPKDCANTPVSVAAGADATICAEKTYQLSGSFGGAATSIVWKTTGSGSFDNPFNPTATYRSSLADVLAGTVKLIICTNDPDGSGPCKATTDTMVLTMQGVKFKPRIAITGNLNSCGSDSVTLTATAGYSYLWFKVGTPTAIATTRSITAKSSGSYFFKLVDANKCCSIESDTAKVNYLASPSAPVANSVKIERGTTVDLNTLVVSNLPDGSTLFFKTGISSSSPTVANPSAVGPGTYYACYRNAQGCFSSPTKITVENKDATGPVIDSDIQVTVTTDKSIYMIGDIITTTITVKNLGPQKATGINVSSTLPSILEYIAQTGGLNKTGNVFTASIDGMVNGEIKIYTYTAKVTGNGVVTIVASGTTTTTDPNPINNNGTGSGGSVTITGGTPNPTAGADVLVSIATDKTTYVVGDVVTTTIKVTNLGPDVAKNIDVFSILPGTLTYIGQTGGLIKTGNLFTASIPSLDKDGVLTYTYTATISTKSETVVSASATSTTKDPNLSNNNGTGSGTSTINRGDTDPTSADVSVVITADKTKAKVGENVNFTLTLTNNGPATATDIVLVNPIPAGMTFVSSSTGQVLTSGAISVNIVSLEKGQVRTYTYVAKMNVITDITNAVSVGSFKDNVGQNNFSFVTINGDTTGTINGNDQAELSILLTADKQFTTKDDVVTFTIKVTNNGPKVANNVVVDNILPKFLTFQTGDPSLSGDTLRMVTASIPVGSVVTYTYKAKVNKDTIISNTARITKSSLVDPVLTNNVSTIVLVPLSDTTNADLGVTIVSNKSTYKVGENVTYTITLINNGSGTAKNVQLCNPISSLLTYVSGTGVTKAGDSVTIKVDNISKGKTQTFTYVTKATKEGTIANTVRICNSSKPDLITANNTSTSSITVTKDSIIATTCKIELAMAILDSAKVSSGVYDVTYSLIAKNVCKDTLKNVTFYNDLSKTFKAPVTCEIRTKPTIGINTNLVPNDAFSKTDSSIVKTGGYMLPNATDTIRYVIRVTLNGNKGPFVSNATMAGKTTGNENLTAKASVVLRFDLPNTRFGLAKEVVTTGLKNDSTTYWTIPYRIRVVNLGANTIAKLSVKDSLDLVFTSKGAEIIGKPIVIATPGLTVNKKYTGRGAFTDLLEPDSSTVLKGETGTIDLTVRVNVANAPDVEKIFNNVAIGIGRGSDSSPYRDVSTSGINPDTNGDKDPTNDNVATPVQLKPVGGTPPQLQVSIGLALAATVDLMPLPDSSYNVTLVMKAKNYGKDALRDVRLCTNISNTIGKQTESWKLVGAPRVIRGNVKISTTFNGRTDSTITKSDSSFIAVGDSIVIAYMVNIKKPLKDTIYTQAIAKARSAVDITKLTSDISMEGLNPDINGNGSPDEAAPTPIIYKAVVNNSTVFVPRGFSPNGDNVNDAFKINGLKDTELNELIIFNRWGGVVFASEDYKNDWIGQSNQGVVAIGSGQGLPDGTYFYCFTRYKKNTDGTKGDKIAPEEIKSITLIR